jgi:hypothetical protein
VQVPGWDGLYLSMEPESPGYIEKHYTPLARVTDLDSTQTFIERFPVENPATVWLSSGADGTSPATAAEWFSMSDQMNSVDIMMVVPCESGMPDDAQKFWRDWANVTRNESPSYYAFTEYWAQNLVPGLRNWVSDNFLSDTGWNLVQTPYGWRYWPDPLDPSAYNSRLIPTHGAVAGAYMAQIYNGNAHRALAENEFSLKGFVNGPLKIYEDEDGIELDNETEFDTRDQLAAVGINLVRRWLGAVKVRNWIFPSNDSRYEYVHYWTNLRVINGYLKLNFQWPENSPDKAKTDFEIEDGIRRLLNKMWQGNLFPFVVAAKKGDGAGAFRDAIDGVPVGLDDVTEIIIESPGPGQKIVHIEVMPYGLNELVRFITHNVFV